jgi:hypothetical protein
MRKQRTKPTDSDDMLTGSEADAFAQALDQNGWMIVAQPQYAGDRWRMNNLSSFVPSWADPAAPKPPPGGFPKRDEERMKMWVAAVLQHGRNLFHQNPDGSWSVRLPNAPLTVIDGDKVDDP